MHFELYKADKLNFVEFNITGSGESLQRCDRDSMYMDTLLFNLFSDCFEKSNNLYDYIGPNKYNFRNIVVLLNELSESLNQLHDVKNANDFETLISQKFLGTNFLSELSKKDSNWKQNWLLYQKSLAVVCKQLIGLVNKCIEQDRILWVVGY